jgi:OOP family OmpA-OmpF porin
MFKKQNFFNLVLMIAFMCLTTIFVVNATGQEVKTMLFKEANISLSAARDVHADFLAPKNFGEAMKYYRDAEDQLQKAKNLDDIRKNLRESIVYFDKAIEATRLAEVTFPNSMKARMDAQNTESAKFSTKLWTEAEEKFKAAATKLEDGDVNDARDEAGKAETLYRQAELAAIKANYLDETRMLLKKAEELDVEDRAPKSLKLAQQLVQQAEKELNENRYDTDVARSMAWQANYQAKHAIYLAGAIKQMKDKDQSWEDLMLASEKPLQQIAEKSDQLALFDTGLGKTTNDIIAYIASCQNRIDELNHDLNFYLAKSDLLDAQVAEMEKMYGNQVKEKSILAQQIADQAKTNELFLNMEHSFSPEEARVLREDNDIIIRLIGLNFPSAKATIEQKSFALLTKVRDAINAFPESTVSVQGHTDSFGGDAQNLQLSKDRAEAVKQYLMANSKLVVSQIEVIGYGESKPISTNETVTGRAANRRVEVVIHPAASTSMVSSK